jgi:hypothetical protein
MERKLAFILLTGLILWAPAKGQGQKPADKTFVLKAARLFDGKSGKLVTPGMVVVSGGKIAGVGVSASVPAGAEVIDLGDATLLPGFIDAHTHLTGNSSDDWRQDTLDTLQQSLAEQAIDSTANARVTLARWGAVMWRCGMRFAMEWCRDRACWLQRERLVPPAVIATILPGIARDCSGTKPVQ